MISKILFLVLLSTQALAFDPDFRLVNERIPLEFQHLFESMKLQVKTPAEKLQLVGICKELDDNLGMLQKDHLFLLMKSEVIKNVLEFKHKKVRKLDVTTFLTKRLNDDYKKKSATLSYFSNWIWRSILAELKHRESLGLVSERSFNAAAFDGPKRIEASRFSRYLHYLLPWIDKMDNLSTSEFNELTKEVSWVILKRLNHRSLLFKRFASTSAGDTKVNLFNIPSQLLEVHPEEYKRALKNEVPLTLKEESEKQKTEATKQIQNVSPDDLSPLSEEVSKELEKKAP